MTDIRAYLRFLPISAQKVRMVIDSVRGKDANQALDILRFTPSRIVAMSFCEPRSW